MTRFSIKSDSDIKVTAWGMKGLITMKRADFRTVVECLCWAKREAKRIGASLAEVRITDYCNGLSVAYSPTGKRLY